MSCVTWIPWVQNVLYSLLQHVNATRKARERQETLYWEAFKCSRVPLLYDLLKEPKIPDLEIKESLQLALPYSFFVQYF